MTRTRKLADLSPEAREQRRARNALYYQENRERMLRQSKDAQKRRWKNQPEIERRKRRHYYHGYYSDPERLEHNRKLAAARYQRDKEMLKARMRERRAADPEAYRQRVKQWRDNKRKRLAQMAEWLAYGLSLKAK